MACPIVPAAAAARLARRPSQRPPTAQAAAPTRSSDWQPSGASKPPPAHQAAERGHAAALRLHLQAAPASALAQDRHGRVPLHHACTGAVLDPAVLEICLEAEPAAICAGAGSRLGTPLHEAARHDQVAALRRMLAADPEADLVRPAALRCAAFVQAWP